MTNSLNNNTHIQVENPLIEFTEKKKIQTFKNQNENIETKFSILQLKEKSDNLETHKKCFFVISDEIKDEEDEVSIKIKRDILVSKLFWDQAIITEKKLESTFEESLLTSTYLTLSNNSRKALMENYSENTQDNLNFQSLIGFEKFETIEGANCSSVNFNPVTNESILNICEKFLKMDDCKINYITNQIVTGLLEQNVPLAESKVETSNINESFKMKSRSPYLEKIVYEDRFNNPNIDVHKQNRLDLTDKIQGDESFDEENLNFFKDFIDKNENMAIKEKVEKILAIFDTEKSNKKMKITNKAKNEILKSLKMEYMSKLQELNSMFYLCIHFRGARRKKKGKRTQRKTLKRN